MAKMYEVKLAKAASVTTPWGLKVTRGKTHYCKHNSRELAYFKGDSKFTVSPMKEIARPERSNRRLSRGEKRKLEEARAQELALKELEAKSSMSEDEDLEDEDLEDEDLEDEDLEDEDLEDEDLEDEDLEDEDLEDEDLEDEDLEDEDLEDEDLEDIPTNKELKRMLKKELVEFAVDLGIGEDLSGDETKKDLIKLIEAEGE